MRWNCVTEAFTVVQHNAAEIHQTPNAIRNSLCGFTDDGTRGTMADQDYWSNRYRCQIDNRLRRFGIADLLVDALAVTGDSRRKSFVSQ